MILLCGIPSESPVEKLSDELDILGIPYLMLNQRRFESASLDFDFSGGQINGTLKYEEKEFDLSSFTGIYTRLIDWQQLPEIKKAKDAAAARQHCRDLHDKLYQWIEIAPAKVVNRSFAMASNSSKPYQCQIIREFGFSVPETLITNCPEEVLAFQAKHGKIIYKSISGVRSIVQVLTKEDEKNLSRIRNCPVQFQQFIDGFNVRVHVIGEEVIATCIDSDATDYRYAARQTGENAVLRPFDLPPDIAQRCINLTRHLQLSFSGIDLKFTPDGSICCFEVNPSPGYSYFENNTQQPIAYTLARYLS
ncbi:ATP-grasp domain-containing protein [Chitinophaga sp. Mgbs1]|uniref:ATP-grasp domain-containing protein n=1 Tax=Chitinophaga solisilvae TaxID=1233460 RepID=A0A3S1BJW1_9BACT|nr:ATP-grasp domain-containing protein [Chitinophaga solisilvae]